MNYSIDFSNYKNNFSLPSLVVECNLKEINSDFLKIILMIFKNPDKNYSVNLLSTLLALDEKTVISAIEYWANHGILILDNAPQSHSVTHVSSQAIPTDKKPAPDSELAFLLSTMEQVLARPVTSTDLKTITYIYEYYRLPADVILMAIQHACERGNKAIKYVEKICIDWYEKGINNHTLAEEYLTGLTKQQSNLQQVKNAFGINNRNLIASEEKYIMSWFNTYGFNIDIIVKAYEKTVEKTGKVAFAYTNKILFNWHQAGYKTIDDVLEKEFNKAPIAKDHNSSYDLDMLDEYWNTVPKLD